MTYHHLHDDIRGASHPGSVEEIPPAAVGIWEGPEGLERLKQYMRDAHKLHKQGVAYAWSSPDYFRGWLHGLAFEGRISFGISAAAHQFVCELGHEQP